MMLQVFLTSNWTVAAACYAGLGSRTSLIARSAVVLQSMRGQLWGTYGSMMQLLHGNTDAREHLSGDHTGMQVDCKVGHKPPHRLDHLQAAVLSQLNTTAL